MSYTISEDQYQSLLSQLKQAIHDVDELKKSEIEIKQTLKNYYGTIVGWIDQAIESNDPAWMAKTLMTVRDSLYGSREDLK